MTPHGIAMTRLYGLVFATILLVVAIRSCSEPERRPHAVAVSVSGVPPTTTELAARIDLLEVRMESRDDALEALLWLSEQDRKDGCR